MRFVIQSGSASRLEGASRTTIARMTCSARRWTRSSIFHPLVKLAGEIDWEFLWSHLHLWMGCIVRAELQMLGIPPLAAALWIG
jgi:hypothetical protein